MNEDVTPLPRHTRPGSVRLDPAVQEQVEEFRRADYRNLNNAVNLLLIEALTARGLWQAQGSTEG
jgi:hypothetical protein